MSEVFDPGRSSVPPSARAARGLRSTPAPYAPAPAEVDDLIRRAEKHPRGTDFLRTGWVDAVSATFGVHAFTVHHARERLVATGRGGEA